MKIKEQADLVPSGCNKTDRRAQRKKKICIYKISSLQRGGVLDGDIWRGRKINGFSMVLRALSFFINAFGTKRNEEKKRKNPSNIQLIGKSLHKGSKNRSVRTEQPEGVFFSFFFQLLSFFVF